MAPRLDFVSPSRPSYAGVGVAIFFYSPENNKFVQCDYAFLLLKNKCSAQRKHVRI